MPDESAEQTDLAELLNDVAPLEPAVAGKHSQRTGVLRVFSTEVWQFRQTSKVTPSGQTWDGAVLYSTTLDIDTTRGKQKLGNKPVVAIIPDDLSSVHAAAIEAGALQSALRTAEEEGADWVARRELIERTGSSATEPEYPDRTDVEFQCALGAGGHQSSARTRPRSVIGALRRGRPRLHQNPASRQRDDRPPRAHEPGGKSTSVLDRGHAVDTPLPNLSGSAAMDPIKRSTRPSFGRQESIAKMTTAYGA